MIDNIELIKPLLTFESEDDFYYLQILQRKKENSRLGSNSRIIKNYYLGSIKYLDDKYDEIKKLCKIFNSRAYIRLNKRSYEKVAFKSLINRTNTIMNKDFINCSRDYDRAVGATNNEKNDKRWIVDLDELYQLDHDYIIKLCNRINSCSPKGNKIKCEIPSKNGLHIITNPFNLQEFNKYKYLLEIHKDNPTNLYIP
jgi:hypothetical protein